MRLPCIDCHGTGRCACKDCTGETCALCGGTGWLHNIGIGNVATEMRRMHQQLLDANAEAKALRSEIARLTKELAYQTDRLISSVPDAAEIAQLREAIGRLPEYQHGVTVNGFDCMRMSGWDCNCYAAPANAARAEARKAAGFE